MTPENLQPHCEQYEEYESTMGRRGDRMRVQYDYRDEDGELFSCIARSLDEARERRDRWKAERATA